MFTQHANIRNLKGKESVCIYISGINTKNKCFQVKYIVSDKIFVQLASLINQFKWTSSCVCNF